jgi:hypothetical protein
MRFCWDAFRAVIVCVIGLGVIGFLFGCIVSGSSKVEEVIGVGLMTALQLAVVWGAASIPLIVLVAAVSSIIRCFRESQPITDTSTHTKKRVTPIPTRARRYITTGIMAALIGTVSFCIGLLHFVVNQTWSPSGNIPVD